MVRRFRKAVNPGNREKGGLQGRPFQGSIRRNLIYFAGFAGFDSAMAKTL